MLSEETGETGVTSGLGGEYTVRMGGPRRYGPREPEGYPSEGWPGWMVGGEISPLEEKKLGIISKLYRSFPAFQITKRRSNGAKKEKFCLGRLGRA